MSGGPRQRAGRGGDDVSARPRAGRAVRTARRRRIAAAAFVGSAILTGVAAASLIARPGDVGPAAHPPDALHERTLRDLGSFAAWLRRNGAQGYIGEVGWPARTPAEGEAWNRVAEAWYARADAERLWVTAWATGTWFDPAYPLAVYDSAPTGLTPSEQAEVVEGHRSVRGVRRGVVVAGGEFGAESPSFSNTRPGEHGTAYRFDPAETFTYLARRGLALVRLPFRWERVQPRLGAALEPTEVERIRRTVGYAHAAGLTVVLDLHNFGEYRTEAGSARLGAEIDAAAFADTWRRLAAAFRGIPGIAGYGLMNEPAHVQPGPEGTTPERTWERLSQAAVTAIRGTGDGRIVFVAGYPWSGVQDWGAHHPRPWISDPLGRIRYEAHHYWDADHSGSYVRTYAEERAAAEGRSRRNADARSSRTS